MTQNPIEQNATMKAIVFDEGSRWEVQNVPVPVPGPGEVRLKVLRTGVCGTDEHLLHGGFIAKLPLIPGHEMLGEVEALGAGADQVEIGDVVAVDNTLYCGTCPQCIEGRSLFCQNFTSLGCNAPGGFAEYVVVQAAKTFVVSDIDPEVAGFAEPTACALHGVDILSIPAAADVLILGAGPTGIILAQLLKGCGARRVVVAAPTASKLEVAKNLGVDVTVQLDRKNPEIGERALRELAPDGFDAVVEATGNTSVLESAVRLTRTGGTTMVYGLAGEEELASIRPYEIFSREITIKGSFAQAFTVGRAVEMLRSGVVRTDGIVTDTVGFDDFDRALANLHDSSQIKTVFVP